MGYLAELSGQDLMLVVECGQHMLTDIESNDMLDPIASYLRRYCDVMDNPDADTHRMTGEILMQLARDARP